MLNDITKKSHDKTSFCNSFTLDGKVINDPKLISNRFCKFSSSIGAKFASKIGSSAKHFLEYMPDPCDSSIYFFPTTNFEIKKIATRLKSKKSSGYDGISNILLKSIIHEISAPLTTIFKPFPPSPKMSKITPLPQHM